MTKVIREAENHPPVLFVLDSMLPGIDGFELCQSMGKHELLRGLPIIILPARTVAADRRLAIQTGTHDYITKPFSPADVIMRVRAVPRWFCVRCEFLKRSSRCHGRELVTAPAFFSTCGINFGEHSLAEPVEGR